MTRDKHDSRKLGNGPKSASDRRNHAGADEALSPRPDAAVVLTKAVLRAAAALQISQKDMAAMLGVSAASFSRLGRSRVIDPATKEGELAALFVRAYRSLDTLVGARDRDARLWLSAEHLVLGARPIERMLSVEGLVDVVQYLDAMRGRL